MTGQYQNTPFGFMQGQKRGDTGIYDGTQYRPSSKGADFMPMRVTEEGASFSSSSLYYLGYAFRDPSRLQIIDGSTTYPVVQDSNTLTARPTVGIFRTVQTGDGSLRNEGGALNVNVWSVAGSGAASVVQAQATGQWIMMDQNESTDCMAYGTQVNMRNLGGRGYGMFAFTQGNPHTFTADASTDRITVTDHRLLVDAEFLVANVGGALPAGLAAGTRYFVKSVPTKDTFTVAASPGGATIDITGAGTGTHYITATGYSDLNPLHMNLTHVPYTYTGSGSVFMANVVMQTVANTALAGMGMWFVRDGTGVQWSEGIVFDADTITNQTFLDQSSSATSIYINGDHSNAAVYILNNNATHYAQKWERTSATAALYGLLIDANGHLNLDEPSVSNKLVVLKGTPGANNTCLMLQQGAGPTTSQVKYFNDGAGHNVLYF